MGRVRDCPEGSPICAVQSPTISTTWCPRSWNCRSLRRPTTCPRWISGREGSKPCLRRSGRPDSSSLISSDSTTISAVARLSSRLNSPVSILCNILFQNFLSLVYITANGGLELFRAFEFLLFAHTVDELHLDMFILERPALVEDMRFHQAPDAAKGRARAYEGY